MNAITVEEMLSLEQSLFDKGIDAATLMEQAGWGIACSMRKFFPSPGRALLYLGKGHNAGDALCAARYLRRWGWQIEMHPAYPEIEWATLTRQQLRALEAVPQSEPNGLEETVIIDGLLGIGARGELRDPIRSAVSAINARRMAQAIRVVALDVPTGLDADTGATCEVAVVADYTFAIGAPKIGLLKSKAVNHVGRLEVIALQDLGVGPESDARLITPQSFPQSLPLRAHDFHKGDAGRVSVIAGSVGMEGAALMTATAALRAGAGLVTLWVSADIYPTVSARACPALMVRPYRQWRKISLDHADAVAIGPGLGLMSEEAFEVMVEMLDKNPCPGVLDADALNAIAQHRGHHCLQARHVITPHLREFTRLAPMSALRPREEACAHFTENNPSVLLLKGARTLVQQRGGPIYHNSTGHAGMATAGMGDVLAGVIAGLQAQGMNALSSACAGSWICGRTAEIIVSSRKQSTHSLIATDLLDNLGDALNEWQRAE